MTDSFAACILPLRRAAASLALFLLFACSTVKSAPQDSSTDHSESAILQLEQKWLKALESGDAAALQTILADDWQDNTSLGRIVTRKEFFDWLAANPPRRILGVTSEIDEPKVRFYGDVAIATGVVVREMNELPLGKKHVQHTLFTDVLVWRDARWQAVASQETLVPGGAE
jgi:ketosteroid isomerase-like protein